MSIKFQTLGQPDIVVQRLAEHWQVLQPINTVANQHAAQLLLSLINLQSNAHYEAHTLTLNEYGLAPPHKTSLLFDGLTIVIGDDDPVENQRYILVNETVHSVDNAAFAILDNPLQQLTQANSGK